MRVIAGKSRRMTLAVPAGNSVRPTTDRIKETLFNIIQADVYGSRFLDLFSGSGGIGIEALSRGAKEAVFVEKSKESLRCIEYNIEHTHLGDNAEILPMDVLNGIRNLSRRCKYFDLVFMDPPYEHNMELTVLEALDGSEIIDEKSLIIIETSLHTDEEQFNNYNFSVVRVKKYKTNQHVFLKYNNKQ